MISNLKFYQIPQQLLKDFTLLLRIQNKKVWMTPRCIRFSKVQYLKPNKVQTFFPYLHLLSSHRIKDVLLQPTMAQPLEQAKEILTIQNRLLIQSKRQ